MSKVVVKPLIDSSELDETMAKVEKLNKLLGEANSLLKELASREVELIASIKTHQDPK